MNENKVLAAFYELPLPVRMRAAACVLMEADKRTGIAGGLWRSFGLRELAARWEREDAEQHRQAAAVEELAEILAIHVGGWDEDAWEDRCKPTVWHDHARRLIRAGYRKQADQ